MEIRCINMKVFLYIERAARRGPWIARAVLRDTHLGYADYSWEYNRSANREEVRKISRHRIAYIIKRAKEEGEL